MPREADDVVVLGDCVERVLALVQRAGDEAKLPEYPKEPGRPDTYGLLTLGDIWELGQGVLAESRARRTTNAARLVRHLFEYDVESEWILRDIASRVERRTAEDLRHATDELPPEEVAHLDLDRAREFVSRVRASLGREEIGRYGELLPSRRAMAKEKGAVEEYDRIYAVLSWLAHPSMVPGSRRVRLMDDQGRLLWQPPESRVGEIDALAQAAHSSCRCYVRLAPLVGVQPPGATVAEIVATVSGIRATHPGP